MSKLSSLDYCPGCQQYRDEQQDQAATIEKCRSLNEHLKGLHEGALVKQEGLEKELHQLKIDNNVLAAERDQLRAQRDHLEKIHENQVRAAALSSKAFDQLRAELARAREMIGKLSDLLYSAGMGDSTDQQIRKAIAQAQAFLKSTTEEKEIG